VLTVQFTGFLIMQIKPFLPILPDFTKIEVSEDFFENVREEYKTYEKQGFFSNNHLPSIFFYEIKTPYRSHLGVVSALDLQDFYDNKVKKHEKTLLEKEQQQMALLLERGTMVKPVLLTYKNVATIQAFIKTHITQHSPTIVYALPEETHRFWQIVDTQTIAAVQQLFADEINTTYIADGHHRLTTNVLLHQTMLAEKRGDADDFRQIFVAFFAADELSISPFHRVVKHDVDNFLEAIAQFATVVQTDDATPKQKFNFAFYHQKKWYNATWKTAIIEAAKANKTVLLDVDLLNDYVLQKILGIADIRKDKRINYIEGNKSITELERVSDKGESQQIAFWLYPVDIQDLMTVSDNDGVMPPKSTFFEPRMKNGMICQAI
jgi:uncharacterized protein (DUF1015 family)